MKKWRSPGSKIEFQPYNSVKKPNFLDFRCDLAKQNALVRISHSRFFLNPKNRTKRGPPVVCTQSFLGQHTMQLAVKNTKINNHSHWFILDNMDQVNQSRYKILQTDHQNSLSKSDRDNEHSISSESSSNPSVVIVCITIFHLIGYCTHN